MTEDEKRGPNLCPHLAVIVNNLWQQNISADTFNDKLTKYPMLENCDNCDKIFVQSAMMRSGMVRIYSILT